ncbi:hypothetical protein [Paraburkholderia sediminicola]
METTINPLKTLAASCRHTKCCQDDMCVACGSPVSTYNANADLINQRPDANDWDWWCACDNADCVHAYGEGIFDEPLEWTTKADASLVRAG